MTGPLALLGGAVLLLLVRPRTNLIAWIALAGAAVYGSYLDRLILTATALTLVMMRTDREIPRHRPELAALILLVSTGGLLLVATNHLAIAYLAFELLSVPAYALVGSIPGHSKSNEAGLKYMVFGGISSAFLLYGFSMMYGVNGTLTYGPAPPVAMVLIAAGAMYKLAAAPFHYWAPDACEGAPLSFAAFLSVVPKIAAVGLILALPLEWNVLLAATAVISMVWGNLGALHQTNIPRLLGYSSVAHAGTILVALAVEAPSAAIFYLTVQVFMNIGAYYVTQLVTHDSDIQSFKGLSRRSPTLAATMAIFLLSLAGIPPFGGFIGKVLIILAALKAGAYILVAAIVINTVIALYYYARIMKAMYFEEGEAISARCPFAISGLAAVVILLGLWWGPVWGMLSALQP